MTWKGMDTAGAELDKLENKIIRSLPGAATAAAVIMMKAARGLAPSATGRLRKNIAIETGKRVSKYRAEAAVYVKKYAFYGAILESEKFDRRQPFMEPAARGTVARMERAIEDHIMKSARY